MKVTFGATKKEKQSLDAGKGDAGRRISVISVRHIQSPIFQRNFTFLLALFSFFELLCTSFLLCRKKTRVQEFEFFSSVLFSIVVVVVTAVQVKYYISMNISNILSTNKTIELRSAYRLLFKILRQRN